ncbi:hypothetical protein [Novosphingobium sp. JCM 18896]|uniref:hypothetical protein n=1 Tax=Novosphingobium sp. JCM 18896 TaxID=2989731 RepID=UPI0022217664|nr:hypothetical protein [Novosphingobium sp. JCM 18896]MCW1431360.1 hypothetical protein [Novosphingobium sp. JCM 18896]
MSERGCNCGAQPHCAYNRMVVFHREDGFYPVIGTACEDWALHASLNPGTVRITTIDDVQIWPEGTMQ